MSSDSADEDEQQQQLADVGAGTDAGAGASTLSTLTEAAANATKTVEAKDAPAEASPAAGLAAKPPGTLVRSAKVPADWDDDEIRGSNFVTHPPTPLSNLLSQLWFSTKPRPISGRTQRHAGRKHAS